MNNLYLNYEKNSKLLNKFSCWFLLIGWFANTAKGSIFMQISHSNTFFFQINLMKNSKARSNLYTWIIILITLNYIINFLFLPFFTLLIKNKLTYEFDPNLCSSFRLWRRLKDTVSEFMEKTGSIEHYGRQKRYNFGA